MLTVLRKVEDEDIIIINKAKRLEKECQVQPPTLMEEYMSEKDLSISEMQKMLLNRLNITPDEYSNAYIEKHNVNMNRNYLEDNKAKYNKKTF